ncbi:MAG: SRPBCC domain-containing protein [Porphyromonadaceae bacterium]|nr:SRPBCC domain-containing protein [Porphyromonadaceae bacterium]
METVKITVQSSIQADIQKVWDYYTQPEHIIGWNFASDDWHCSHATNDLRVGGQYSARMEAKDGSNGFDFNALYDEVAAYEKIAYTMEDGRKAMITFTGDNGTTWVKVTFDAENQNDPQMQRDGWQAILDNFKKYAELKALRIFVFSVDKENNTISIKRDFNATLQQVWRAWTTAELLDQWWGPKPWWAETKTMDFREGGHWLYAMVGPEGDKHWGRADYINIKNEKSFRAKDSFCDENGVLNPELPQNLWEIRFRETDGKVLVDITLIFDKPEDLETNIRMGFREGFTIGLNQLDTLLLTLGK